MPNEILTDMTNTFDWYGKMFDWYEKKLTDMKKTVDWYGKNHISQTFLTDMVLTTPDGRLLHSLIRNTSEPDYTAKKRAGTLVNPLCKLISTPILNSLTFTTQSNPEH